MSVMNDDDLRRAAARRTDAKLGFRSHLVVYVIVNAGLAGINLMTSRQYLWFVWPLFGWGIGVVAHGLAVYGVGQPDREAMITREMERLRSREAGRH